MVIKLPAANEDGFRYFHRADFACKHTGKNEIDEVFVHKLDQLRYICGFPFVVTSGYRHETHPAEAKKSSPGEHNKGIAADIAISGGAQRRAIVENALKMGFRGVGVAKGFVHVDIRDTTPVMWTY
jgi:zinc D-Ala-D-Ala carboxypeptidase